MMCEVRRKRGWIVMIASTGSCSAWGKEGHDLVCVCVCVCLCVCVCVCVCKCAWCMVLTFAIENFSKSSKQEQWAFSSTHSWECLWLTTTRRHGLRSWLVHNIAGIWKGRYIHKELGYHYNIHAEVEGISTLPVTAHLGPRVSLAYRKLQSDGYN